MSRIDEAVQSFQMLVEQGFRPNLVTFEILIDGLLNAWRGDEASKLQAIMEKDFKIAPRIGIYNLWIAFHLKNGNLERANELLRQLKSAGIKVNEMTFRNFLKFHIANSDFLAVEQLRKQMEDEAITPTAQFYDALIKAFAKRRILTEIDTILDEMRATGAVPLPSTYMTVAKLCASLNETGRLASIFEEMNVRGIKPDIKFFNNLLEVYSESDSSERARSLLLEMNNQNLAFNAFTYAALLYGLIKQHKFFEAVEMITKMDNCGVSLPVCAYARLIQLCCEKRFHPGIRFLVGQMRAAGVKPNLPIFSSLMDMNLKLKRYDAVDGLLREMDSLGLKWNTQVYGMMLNHFIEHFDLERIRILLQRMQHEGISVTDSINDTLMRAFYIYCRYAQGGYLFRVNHEASPKDGSVSFEIDSGRLDLGRLKKSFEQLFGVPFRLSVHIFNDLMLNFLRLARFEEFFECFAEIRKNGLKPNLFTYTLLIKARLYLGQPDAARDLLSEMLKLGLKPTVLQCALIFHYFCKLQATSQAESLLNEMTTLLQLRPNHVYYASLLYAYSRKRDYPNVFATYDRLERAGFIPDTETCNFVLVSLYEICEYSEASRFFEKMVLQGVRRNTHTYYIMADRLILQGDADRFLEKLVDCLTPGNSIDAMPFNRLFGNYFRTGQFDVLHRVMEKMIEVAVKFDEGTLSYVSYLFTDHLNTNNFAAAETILRKAIVDYDPSNVQVNSMMTRYRETLQACDEFERLAEFDKFLDCVDDLKRLWILPSPLLPSELALAETNVPIVESLHLDDVLTRITADNKNVE